MVLKKVSVEKSELLSDIERVQLEKVSFQRVVVEFWRWKSKVIEKKCQEMN
jgi:hypothetical protein